MTPYNYTTNRTVYLSFTRAAQFNLKLTGFIVVIERLLNSGLLFPIKCLLNYDIYNLSIMFSRINVILYSITLSPLHANLHPVRMLQLYFLPILRLVSILHNLFTDVSTYMNAISTSADIICQFKRHYEHFSFSMMRYLFYFRIERLMSPNWRVCF